MSRSALHARLKEVYFDSEDRARFDVLTMQDEIVRAHANRLEFMPVAPPATVLVDLLRDLVESRAHLRRELTRLHENYAVPMSITVPKVGPESVKAYDEILKMFGSADVKPTSEGK